MALLPGAAFFRDVFLLRLFARDPDVRFAATFLLCAVLLSLRFFLTMTGLYIHEHEEETDEQQTGRPRDPGTGL